MLYCYAKLAYLAMLQTNIVPSDLGDNRLKPDHLK